MMDLLSRCKQLVLSTADTSQGVGLDLLVLLA